MIDMETRWIGNAWLQPLSDAEQKELGYGSRPRQYRLKNEPHNRLTLIHKSVMYRIQDDLILDLGSIPPIIQTIPGYEKDRYWKSYSLHDQGYHCDEDFCHRVWISRDNGVAWNFEKVTRNQMDTLLKPSMMAEGAPRRRANIVREFVKVFGWFSWK